jgi:putative membrane protein
MMKTKLPIILWSTIMTTFLVGCVGPMGGYGHMTGYGGYGGFMWLILLIIAGIVIYFVWQKNKTTGGFGGPAKETPMEILKRRYASGEITKEEFERMKREIEG